MRLAAIFVLLATAAHAAPAPLGDVAFANSCTAAAQAPFLRGLALLHNFEYSDSTTAFQAAEAADPNCAIAYWGEAMTYNHPLWMEQDADAARKALARLGATPALRAARAKTPREAAYLHAVDILYGPGAKEARDDLYAADMARLHARFPADVDGTAFTALSLLGTSHDGRDIPTYMKSAALLEEVFPTHPHHPGVLHYMIHSYDDPAHAPLGMRAARLYAGIAAGAPHALHMTSHIFVALGMWDEVIAANQAAQQAVNTRAAAEHERPVGCGHYAEWLVYGLLQERRFAEANTAIAACHDEAAPRLAKRPQPAFPGHSPVMSYAAMLTMQAIETGQYRAAAALPFDDGAYIPARFDAAYATALTAGTDTGRRTAAIADLHASFARLQTQPVGGYPGMGHQQMQIAHLMVEQADAVALPAPSAIAALRQIAQQETAIPAEFGPPAVPKPTWELLGDLLLAAGQPADAARAYQTALVHAPGRTLSLQGLMAAQKALHDADAASASQASLAKYVKG